MSANREIEAKTLLNKQVYAQLKRSFPVKTDFTQANYYFDSPQRNLAAQKIGLRIRLFVDHAEQTMKVPDQRPVQQKFHEVIEINDPLPLKKAQKLIQQAEKGQKILFHGSIGKYLQSHPSLPQNNLRLLTWSKTHRLLANGPQNCELTLDATVYPDHCQDYELEIENPQPSLIKQTQLYLEKRFGFKQTASNTNQNKIARAFQHRLAGKN